MKKNLILLVITGLMLSAQLPSAFGQANDEIIYGGLTLIKNVGRYNAARFGVGVSGRYQYPLTRTVSLTAKAGVEVYRVRNSYLYPSSYLGYGYNAITGFGFNTIYYNYYSAESRGRPSTFRSPSDRGCTSPIGFMPTLTWG